MDEHLLFKDRLVGHEDRLNGLENLVNTSAFLDTEDPDSLGHCMAQAKLMWQQHQRLYGNENPLGWASSFLSAAMVQHQVKDLEIRYFNENEAPLEVPLEDATLMTGLKEWRARLNCADCADWIPEVVDYIKVELKAPQGQDPRFFFPRNDPNADQADIPDIQPGTRLLLQFRPVKSEGRCWGPYLHYFTSVLVPRENGQLAGIKPRTGLAREWRDEIQESKGRGKGRKGAPWKR